MKWTLTIDKRLFESIKGFCELNNIKPNDYVCDIIERQLNLDKYGDLNDKIKKPIIKPISGEMVKPVKIEPETPKTEEIKVEEPKIEVEKPAESEEPIIKKRTRTLKTR